MKYRARTARLTRVELVFRHPSIHGAQGCNCLIVKIGRYFRKKQVIDNLMADNLLLVFTGTPRTLFFLTNGGFNVAVISEARRQFQKKRSGCLSCQI